MSVGQQRRTERTTPAVGVPEDVDPAASLLRDRRGDGRHIFELALDGVGRRVPRRSPPATVDRVDRERVGEQRSDDPERRVVRGRAVDEDQRRPRPRT